MWTLLMRVHIISKNELFLIQVITSIVPILNYLSTKFKYKLQITNLTMPKYYALLRKKNIATNILWEFIE